MGFYKAKERLKHQRSGFHSFLKNWNGIHFANLRNDGPPVIFQYISMRGSLLTGFCKSSPPEGRPISMLLRCQHIFRGSYGYLDMGQTFFMPLEFQVFHVKTPIPFFMISSMWSRWAYHFLLDSYYRQVKLYSWVVLSCNDYAWLCLIMPNDSNWVTTNNIGY